MNMPNIPVIGDVGYFVINTNERYIPGIWRTMLNDFRYGKASVHNAPNCGIKGIEIGDRVYLLQRQVGIIACGIAVSKYQKAYLNELPVVGPNMEVFVNLRFIWALDEPQWNYAPRVGEIQRRSGDPQPFIGKFTIIDRNRSDAIESILSDNI